MTKLVSRNPATGEIIQELDQTPIEDLPKIFDRAYAAQLHWSTLPIKSRAAYLIQLREVLLNQTDDIIDIISAENGKPKFEAMVNELLPALDSLTFFAKKAPKTLRKKNIPLNLMKHRRSDLHYWPIGTVVVISPWNYPFLLPFVDILMALVAGNAVVFKPSEVTPCVGLKIQELCNEAGFPAHLVQTLIGDGKLGAALVHQKPGKIFFTGSVATGKKVMAAAAEYLIPVNLELGGKDPMIILPDADLEYASSAALWGAFSNSGQICASTERILVHERIAVPFLEKLKGKVSQLRQGPPGQSNVDLGAITFERQKQVYDQQLEEARSKGAQFVTGGEFSEDRRYLKPTVIAGNHIEELEVYNEETFGPVVAVTTFRSVSEAVEKANRNRYGLVASVITRDIGLGEQVAKQLAVGTVNINEVVYTGGLVETPWGGMKDSGFGKTHSEMGLYEFVNIRHIHKPRLGIFVFKSLWWFPYTPLQYETFRTFLGLYRKQWLDRLKALPHFLWYLIKFIKEEKRL